jgi:hypothetical protein
LLLFPNLFGDFSLYFGGSGLAEISGYCGWATIFFVILNLVANRVDSRSLFWIAAACVSFAFALGAATPLSRIAYHLPVIGQFRVPARALIATDFAVAILGGVGLAHLLSGRVGRKQLLATCVTFSAISVVALAAVLINYSAVVQLAATAGLALPEAAFANESVYVPLILAAATIVLIPIFVRAEAALRGAQCVLF